jgi:hypothetical protein
MKTWVFLIAAFVQVFATAANEIRLIWLCPGPAWETDWIHEVLSGTQRTIHEIYDGNYETILDNSIIVSSYPDKAKYQKYYQAFRDRGYKFAIIHLSDEAYEHPHDFYNGAQFVLRNYWHEYLNNNNVLAFPLGYKERFWDNYPKEMPIPPIRERKYTWSFAGTIQKTTRLAMYANMRKIPNHFVHEIPHFAASTMLPVNQYRDLLLNTIFVPCPKGNINLDSFRVCEALECGCIPIVEKSPYDYFAHLFGQYPFIAVNNWKEAPAIVKRLLADPKSLEELQTRCYNWWKDYKNSLKTKVADLIESKLAT